MIHYILWKLRFYEQMNTFSTHLSFTKKSRIYMDDFVAWLSTPPTHTRTHTHKYTNWTNFRNDLDKPMKPQTLTL